MPTIPAPNAPTEQEIYASSKLRWSKFKITGAQDLEEPLLEALSYITTMTGRYFVDWPAPGSFSDAMSLAATPELIVLARQATRMRVEQIVEQKQPGYIDTATDDVISGMSVGAYSETRRDPTRRGEEKILNLWPALNDLLWVLMTPERYDYWIAYITGKSAPAFSVEEVDWALVGKDLLWGPFVGPYDPWPSLFPG